MTTAVATVLWRKHLQVGAVPCLCMWRAMQRVR